MDAGYKEPLTVAAKAWLEPANGSSAPAPATRKAARYLLEMNGMEITKEDGDGIWFRSSISAFHTMFGFDTWRYDNASLVMVEKRPVQLPFCFQKVSIPWVYNGTVYRE